MPIKIFITKDFEHMSRVAADMVKKKLIDLSRAKKEVVLGLATGNSPTGMYRHLARAANNGERKVESVTRSLLGERTPEVPNSYGQKYADTGDTLIYVLDKIAGRDLLAHKAALRAKKISIEDWTKKLVNKFSRWDQIVI